MLPYRLIEQRLQSAVATVLHGAAPASVLVRPCPDAKFGDYQCAALMSLAKARKQNPRALAEQVVAKLDVRDLCAKVEVAGPGFLNFHLTPAAVAEALRAALAGEHLFFARATQPRTLVIDFSSPNVAKPMHVGHIRSTILGDCLARLFRLLGHRVITDNHLGDWGTQFGMLLVGWKRDLDPAALDADPIAEMERIYKKISAECKETPTTLEAARQELVKLQAGDAENLGIWRRMIELSQHQFDTIYGRLGVKFDHTLGESFYNPRLKDVIADLLARGIARESEGAQVIFFEDIPALKAHPTIIQKSDGGANYATTDLATLAYRLETWQPDEIVYVTDGRQQLHFQQIFAVFKKWREAGQPVPPHPSLLPPGEGATGSAAGAGQSAAPQPAFRIPHSAFPKLAHVWFGSILGEDGKPFKTRSGETVKLADLLDEAEERALKAVTEKNPTLLEAERKEIARVVGLGAVKYADLLPNRQSDYVFSWDRMLALSGNTAPYLQYAYTRIRSIFRKSEASSSQAVVGSEAGRALPLTPALSPWEREARVQSVVEGEAPASSERRGVLSPLPECEGEHTSAQKTILLTAPEELALAKQLLNFGLVLEAVAEEYRPNYLCNYLYELAGGFTRFYETCPVLKAEEPQRSSRLALCELTARVMHQGLDVLGIETPEQM
jgi:arginyl-tRNA synthetase